MVRGKRRALRLALYLASIQIQSDPYSSSYKNWATTLHNQYKGLTSEEREFARRLGRQHIRTSGSLEAALRALVGSIDGPPRTTSPTSVTTPDVRKEKTFDLICGRWSKLTPPRPRCRMRNGFPKRSWPSEEWAYEVWARQHDRQTLRVYQCPAQPGFRHLGHVQSDSISIVSQEVDPLTSTSPANISSEADHLISAQPIDCSTI